MPSPTLRIATVGGVPPVLGGGGLEHQMACTADALRARGHDVRPAHLWEPGDELDVVHAFNHSGDVVHQLEHWRRSPAALVLSPVLVVAPSREWRTRVGRFLPVPGFPARSLRDLVRAADAVVGLTRWEAAFMADLAGVDGSRCHVVGNGVDPVGAGAPPPGLPAAPYAISVGAVSPRKGQRAVAEALATARLPYIVVGGLDGDDDPASLTRVVEATGGRWLGEERDASVVRAAIAGAAALVQCSEREGQSLAVLEALSVGTPVIGSDLPSHRELAERFPGWVGVVEDPSKVPAAIGALAPTTPAPAIPTWDDVAAALATVYARAMQVPPRTGRERR